jgi:hypothetical protein
MIKKVDIFFIRKEENKNVENAPSIQRENQKITYVADGG